MRLEVQICIKKDTKKANSRDVIIEPYLLRCTVFVVFGNVSTTGQLNSHNGFHPFFLVLLLRQEKGLLLFYLLLLYEKNV